MLISNKKNDKVGNYQIGEMLGKGAFGTVMKGLNQETGTSIEMKIQIIFYIKLIIFLINQ